MGLFDVFARKGPGAIRKHATRVANRRAQGPDRWESIHALIAMGSEEAVDALLVRFTYSSDPSITDQEEKDAVFRGIVGMGQTAIEPVRRFMQRTTYVSWSLKILERLLEPTEVVTELVTVLEAMDTEYERDPDKKIQLVAYMEDRSDARIVDAVARFLDDVNETVRFHAVGALLAQEAAEPARDALLELIAREESVRVCARALEGFAARGWSVPAEQREAVRAQLPDGFALDGGGVPRR